MKRLAALILVLFLTACASNTQKTAEDSNYWSVAYVVDGTGHSEEQPLGQSYEVTEPKQDLFKRWKSASAQEDYREDWSARVSEDSNNKTKAVFLRNY